MGKPWERKPGESSQAYAAFCLYRDLPYGAEPEKRSLTKAGQKLNKNRATLSGWSSKWEWQERCREYDNELQRVELAERKRKIKRMQEKHLSLSDELMEAAQKALKSLHNGDYKPRDVLDFLKLSVELERRASFELLADIELKAGGDPEKVAYSPMMQLVESLRRANAARQEEEQQKVVIYLPEKEQGN